MKILGTWNRERYLEAGFPDVEFVLENHSRSDKGVLRSIYAKVANPQDKLAWIRRGDFCRGTAAGHGVDGLLCAGHWYGGLSGSGTAAK